MAASAGGLEPLAKILEQLPKNPGFSLILVLPPEPGSESHLGSLLQRSSAMPVVQAVHDQIPEQNHVYTSPPGAVVGLRGSRLEVWPRSAARAMPADHLFRALASSLGSRAIGVVLSGCGTDGTLGLQEISAAQGVVFAQDGSALHTHMPRSAIGSGAVDFVLSPEAIARELVRIAGFHARYSCRPDDGDAERAEMERLFGRVLASTGIDFSQYKHATVRRRVRRRMALHRAESLGAYLRLLDETPGEIHALCQDLLLRVTSFFRDPQVYQTLREVVFPSLVRAGAGRPIRIWVAACSTGEEVYSIAMELLEFLGDSRPLQIQILGTDIDERALERARAGSYIENIRMDVPPERLRRWFTRNDSHYTLSKSIRDLCVFARHDLIRDPPLSHIDLISCRNVLIYLNLALQRRLLPLLHSALHAPGYLMLGASESAGGSDDLFVPVNESSRIYARKMMTAGGGAGGAAPAGGQESAAQERVATSAVQQQADRLILQRYGPAGVVIDEGWNILQFRGHTGPYLEPSPGLASLKLQRMVRDGLLPELRSLIDRARSTDLPASKRSVPISPRDRRSTVDLEVIPFRVPGTEGRWFLVVFEGPSGPPPPLRPLDEPPGETRLQELERERDATRDHLQATLGQLEAEALELDEVRRELKAADEALRGTRLELQAAREEMQSANEELKSVNEELHHRNRELGKLNDDLANLFLGVEIPIVMVGRDLRIRRMTPPAEKVFNLLPIDVGRPISDIRSNLDIPEFEALISEVIRSFAVRELEVRERGGGRWFAVRIQPYVTADNKIDGASIVAFDIDPLRRSLERLQNARNGAEAIVDAVRQPLVLLDHELRLQRGNPAFYEISGLRPEETVGRTLFRVGHGEWANPELISRLEAGVREFRGLEITMNAPGAGSRVLLVHGCQVTWDGHEVGPMFLLVFEDVTELRREIERATALAREQEARIHAEAASRAKDEFLAMLAHELRNPLAPLTTALRIIRSGEEGKREWALSVAERQVRQMVRIIDDLLDVSRITGNKIRLQKALVELTAAVRRVVDGLRPSIEEARLSLSVSLSGGSVWMMADAVRIEQVLGNLLNNAVKYTPEGGTIEVEMEVRFGSVRIRIRDSGVGISEAMLPRVFDLFTQAEQASDRAKGGLGIGLTLVKRLTEMHGGTVEVSSAGLGQGSEFLLTFPTIDVLTPAAPPGPEPSETTPRRILVVDDNRDAADSLSLLLGMSGHEVRTAYDGPQALALAQRHPPEVVFLDIGLPGMDGHEVARLLRKSLEVPPVLVALTGYGQAEDRQRTAAAGFDHHLVKPVDIGVLEQLFFDLQITGA